MATRTDTLPHFLTDVADAIRTKAGTSEPIQASSFDTAIANIPSGGEPVDVEEKDVNFYDYEGTRIYSYTKTDFLALNELPTAPTLDGLTSQGWNWPLSEMKSYVQKFGYANNGACYVTNDNSFRIYFEVPKDFKTIYLCFSLDGTATINWGDNNTSEITGSSLAEADLIRTPHTYSDSGNYVISISTNSGGKIQLWGSSAGGHLLKTEDSTTAYSNWPILSKIKKLEFGDNVYLGQYAFQRFTKLKFVSFPKVDRVETVNYLFQYCYDLKYINIPYVIVLGQAQSSLNVETLITYYTDSRSGEPTWVCNGMTYLKNYTIYDTSTAPNTYKNVAMNGFNGCRSLTRLAIPSRIQTIHKSAFANNEHMKYYDFSQHTSVPTLNDTNAFSSISSDCQIRVPQALLNDWKAASNWSTYADHIVGV